MRGNQNNKGEYTTKIKRPRGIDKMVRIIGKRQKEAGPEKEIGNDPNLLSKASAENSIKLLIYGQP